MAKDDYYVLVYKILSYLYACLKSGNRFDMSEMTAVLDKWKIDAEYRRYIWYNLASEGLIDGLDISPIDNAPKYTYVVVDDIGITPKGIDYLQENAKMKKLADSLGGIFGLAVNARTFFGL